MNKQKLSDDDVFSYTQHKNEKTIIFGKDRK
jgi:hypothetical protein